MTHAVLRRALITMIEKSADLTVVQQTLIDTLYKEPRKVTAERVGCSQSAGSKYIHEKLIGRQQG